MKKVLAIALGMIVIVSIFSFTYYNKILYGEHLAAVLKIETEAVKKWQQDGGLQHTLAFGSRGNDVTLLQRALQTDNGSLLTPSGYYGNETVKAIKLFQKSHNLPETGTVGDQTRKEINTIYFDELCPQADMSNASNTPDLMYTLIDKNHPLPEGYTPPDLVDITSTVKTEGIACLRREAAGALQNMFVGAQREGISLAVTSSFRREEIQKLLHDFWLSYNYQDNIDKIAEPLHSEHQLGTAVDLTGRSNGYNGVDPDFSKTIEGVWLTNHAYEYGFVLSYPDGKKNITGYDYEPWHYRYIGLERAKVLHDRSITFNEFIGS